MNTDPSTLINGYLDDLLSEEQVRELNDWIKADRRNARRFASAALMHDRLHGQFRSRAVLRGRRFGPGGGLLRGHRWRWGLAAAALVGVLLSLASRPVRRGGDGGGIATLVEARDVVWAAGQSPIAEAARIKPGEIRCLSGTLRLAFDCGALVTSEGPADLRVLSPMRLRAARGRITARVEHAKGFAIETPSTLVVDQGTEFGVEVDDSGQTGVVVFEGRVDLSRRGPADLPATIKQLVRGEAMRIGPSGGLSRIVAVDRRPGDAGWSIGPSADRDAVIRSVRDNIRGLGSSKYYQVVHRGLDDGKPAYVDRLYQWKGPGPDGLPGFLRGADYVMPFNDDKWTKELQVTVEVARAATLYVFYDDRQEIPGWLAGRFTDTGVDVVLDASTSPTWKKPRREFPFSVWKRELERGEAVVLGSIELGAIEAMYGIAAVALP